MTRGIFTDDPTGMNLDPLSGQKLQSLNADPQVLSGAKTLLRDPINAEGSGPNWAAGADAIAGMFGKLGGGLNKFFSSPEGEATTALAIDAMKRQDLLPVLEAEAMFKAFGRSGLTDTAKQGIVGQDVVGTLAKADAAEKLAERNRLNDEAVRELFKSLAKKQEHSWQRTSDQKFLK